MTEETLEAVCIKALIKTIEDAATAMRILLASGTPQDGGLWLSRDALEVFSTRSSRASASGIAILDAYVTKERPELIELLREELREEG